MPGWDVGSPHIELPPLWLWRAWSEELGQPCSWSFEDEKGDDDTLDNVKAKEIPEHKVEENLFRLLHDDEDDDYKMSCAKKKHIDDEKNAGLHKKEAL